MLALFSSWNMRVVIVNRGTTSPFKVAVNAYPSCCHLHTLWIPDQTRRQRCHSTTKILERLLFVVNLKGMRLRIVRQYLFQTSMQSRWHSLTTAEPISGSSYLRMTNYGCTCAAFTLFECQLQIIILLVT